MEWWKKSNKRVNEETDSRRVEEEENNLGRDIKESSLEKGIERKEKEKEERRWADSVLYVLVECLPGLL